MHLISAGIELVAVLGIVGYIRKLTRLVSLLEDYPPHRHVSGEIAYPPAYPPGKLEKLGVR